MVHHFDHRFGTYEGQTEAQANQGKLPELDDDAHANPDCLTLPRYWVGRGQVDDVLADQTEESFVGWRDICRATDTRTVIASVLPRAAVGHTTPVLFSKRVPREVACLYANLCSFVLDYTARQKIGGTHLTYSYLKQLPLLQPATFGSNAPWFSASSLSDWLSGRVVELTHTAWDTKGFARDTGYQPAPFRWDAGRRAHLRAELDAAFFHLYGLSLDDAEFILDTFLNVRKTDEREFGEYRTKRLILEIYGEMAEAIRTGRPYQTRLEPPPADPRVAHPPREAGA